MHSAIGAATTTTTTSRCGLSVHAHRATWLQRAYIKGSNTEANDYFGGGVALSGDGLTLAVGAGGESSAIPGISGNQADNSTIGAGAVYVFQ